MLTKLDFADSNIRESLSEGLLRRYRFQRVIRDALNLIPNLQIYRNSVFQYEWVELWKFSGTAGIPYVGLNDCG